VLYDAMKKEQKVIMEQNSPIYAQFMAGMSHEFSADKNYILFQTQFLKLFRHSFMAEWKILDIANNRMLNVTIGDEQPSIYRLVKFAPSGNALIIVHKNNIYYKSDPLAEEIQVTKDGIENETFTILNGVTDWIYEEEVFSANEACWFSQDGKKLAFIQFDDSHVPDIGVPHYGSPGQFQYPLINEIKYPKSGAPNPFVKLFYIDFDGINAGNADQKIFNISVPTELASEQHLITSVSWANPTTLISVWMNRVQNKAIISKCIIGGNCTNAHTIQSTNGWVEFYTSPFFNKDGSQMIYIEPYNDYRHLQVLDLNSNSVSPRTSGKFIVTEILKYNQENDVILYTANLESDIKAQHVYAVKNEAGKTPVCLTCELHESYSYYGADVSEDGSVLVINANGPGIPRADLYLLHVDGEKC
jgi:dipeptidyl-peptidase 4